MIPAMAPLSPLPSPMNSPTRPSSGGRRLSSFHTVRKQPRLSTFCTPRRRETLVTPSAKGKTPLPPHTPGRRKSSARALLPADAAAHASVPITRMSDSELAEMYSTTIKLCQDNKINAKNTWSLNLIDYMSMLVKDRATDEGEAETTAVHAPAKDTNFQMAGVTLDAGVRIYCSRVDSVHTNAFKVLGALSRSSKPNASGDMELDDGEDDDTSGPKKRKRSAHRSGGNTLEGNIESITARKLETDLAVDPLFQKMSAAFDEGGAKGMLLNNLGIGPKCEIIFDSSEPAQPDRSSKDEREQSESEGSRKDGDETSASATDAPTYDVSRLLPPTAVGDASVALCPRFMTFFRSRMSGKEPGSSSSCSGTSSSMHHSAESSSTAAFDDSSGTQLSFEYGENDIHATDALGPVAPSIHDPMMNDEANELDDDDDVGAFNSMSGRLSTDSSASALSSLGSRALMAGRVDLVEAGMALHQDSEYSFFDAGALASWAGPQHWHFRAATASSRVGDGGSTSGDGKSKKRPKGKTAMLLDYSSQAPDIDFAAEFARPTNPASCQLSASVQDNFAEKKVTLPEDQHFKTETLATLFLKPKLAVVARRRRSQNVGDTGADGVEEDASARGWYDFENDVDDNFCPAGDDDAHDIFTFDDDGTQNPTQSQLDGTDLVPEPTRVEKIDIGFATVAKKVDVRQLKSGMWSHLRAGAPDDGAEQGAEKINEESTPDRGQEQGALEANRAGSSKLSDAEDVRAGGTQTLQQLVGGMPVYVPENSLPDVSLSYVFICLLHLANEKTLSIKPAENGSLDDLIITSSKGPE